MRGPQPHFRSWIHSIAASPTRYTPTSLQDSWDLGCSLLWGDAAWSGWPCLPIQQCRYILSWPDTLPALLTPPHNPSSAREGSLLIAALCSRLCPELQFTSRSEVVGGALLPAHSSAQGAFWPLQTPFLKRPLCESRCCFHRGWEGGGECGSQGPASPEVPFPAPNHAANPRTSTPSSPSETFQEPGAPGLGSAPSGPRACRQEQDASIFYLSLFTKTTSNSS